MDSKTSAVAGATGSGVSLGTLVFAVFLFLKLAGMGVVANWSWVWVCSPLWIPPALVIGIIVVIVVVYALLAIPVAIYERFR